MVQTHENQEEIDQLLDEARRRLKVFEERVDYGRLLLRLRTASPAHPVLIARFMFALFGVLFAVLGLAVLSVPFIDNDLARQLAKLEAVIPYVPDDVPALPAVFGLLAACMFVAWVMSTGAALAIGRDSKLLPHEQKQHQVLVNEIARLNAVRSVNERIRHTPASARPRIATPSPTSMRNLTPGQGSRAPVAPRSGEPDSPLGFRRTPTPASAVRPATPQPTGYRGESPLPPGQSYPYAGFGTSSPADPSAPRPAGLSRSPAPSRSPVPPRGTSTPWGNAAPSPSPSPIASPPAATPPPLRATPRMGASDVPPFDEAALDARDPGSTLPVADEGFDPTSPDLLADPRPAPWELPPSQRQTMGIDDSFDLGVRFGGPSAAPVDDPSASQSLVPLLDLEPDLDGPDDIEAEHIAEVELVDTGMHEAVSHKPLLPPIDPQTGPVPPSDGPVVYDPAAVRPSPARAPQVRRPASPSEAPTVRESVVSEAAMVQDVPSEDLTVRPDPDQTLVTGLPAVPVAPPPPAAPPTASPPTPSRRAPSRAAVPPAEAPVDEAPPAEVAQGGILARARAGGWSSRETPYGSAGRIRPSGGPTTRSPRNTRGGTPLGAPPQESRRGSRSPSFAPRAPVDVEPPATTERDERARSLASLSRLEPEEPEQEYEEDEVTVLGAPGKAAPRREDDEERWIGGIVKKAQALARHLPAQAQMSFSQEPHLPFTLVIARATPTVAVRAMMSFVEFIANIPTPPRARIELVQVSHLDRSFHRNVQAALEPHFDRNVVVEPQAGRVDIRFTDPDPRWGRHPRLPA